MPCKAASEHENDFFDGIDTTLPGLAARAGAEEAKAPFLRPALESIARHVEDATKAFSIQDSSGCVAPLLAGLAETQKRSEEHTSELQSPDHLVCRLLLE